MLQCHSFKVRQLESVGLLTGLGSECLEAGGVSGLMKQVETVGDGCWPKQSNNLYVPLDARGPSIEAGSGLCHE